MENVSFEVTFIHYLLSDFGFLIKNSSNLFGDNKSALHIATDSIFYELKEQSISDLDNFNRILIKRIRII